VTPRVPHQRRKLRVLALVEAPLVPPEDASIRYAAESPWKTEFDVLRTLRKLGHEVQVLGVDTDLGPIREAVGTMKPDLVFNLLEDFDDVPVYDQNVVSYLELLRVPYTGCNPRGLILARDKALSKKVLSYHRVRVPEFAVVRMGQPVRRPKRLAFPLIVKSLVKEGSAGIAQTSLVDSDQKLAERVRFVHQRLATDAIVERYIDGRELYVGVLGNHRLRVLPIWELSFRNLPDEAPRIATEKVKWDRRYQRKVGVRTALAKDLPEPLVHHIQRLCRRIYRILEITGYARLDFRLTPDGQVYVLEANPNPQLADGEDFADSAAKSGLSYAALLQRIMNLALEGRTTTD